MPVRSDDVAVFLVSIVLIGLQVVLMQALAEAQGHHFAYIVISLALLGFGSSGTALALARTWTLARADRLAPVLLLLAGLACMLALPVARYIAALADFPLLFVDWRAWLPLLAAAGLAWIPFFLGALFLGLAFMSDTRSIGRLYAANLLGSALGSVLGLILLFRLSAEQAFPFLGCLLVCAAWSANRKPVRFLSAACGPALLLGLVVVACIPDMPVSVYKALSYARHLPRSAITAESRHPMGRLHIVESPALRHAPGLSLHYVGEIAATPHLFRNGDSFGAFLPPLETGGHILDHGVQALPLVLADPGRALVLHAGAGATLGHLLSRPGISVEAVEPHPVAARWLREAYPDHGGRLTVTVGHGRAFLDQVRQGYDLVLLPAQGAFGGGIGLHALQENYLLTREAFLAMWNALSTGDETAGLLSFSIHLDHPPRQSLKLLSLLTSAMIQSGIEDPSLHVAAVRSWEMLSLAASPRPFDASALQRLELFARTGGFDRVWIPGHGPALEDRFHLMLKDILADGFSAVLQGNEESFGRDYLFDIAAPDDERPYFHQFIRWDRLDDVRRELGQGSMAFVEMGSILVAATVAILGGAAFILVLAPLFRLGRRQAAFSRGKSGGRAAVLGYFGAIGLGFMFLEIAWIQRFTLFWGHPLTSAAGVIAALLTGMGTGSALSSRLPAVPGSIRLVLILILGLTAAYSVFLPWLMSIGLGWSGPLKWLVGLILLAVPAILLGMPFPLALRILGANRQHLVPWAWGINGCFSVLAAPLAVFLAMQYGFGQVAGIATGAYLLALCSSFLNGLGDLKTENT